MFFSAVVAYYSLHLIRQQRMEESDVKHREYSKLHATEADPAELHIALRSACEAGDHSEVIKYWNLFKYCDQAPSVGLLLSHVTAAMFALNITVHCIGNE